MGSDAAVKATLGQDHKLLLLLKLGLDDVALSKVQGKLDVDLDQVVFQLELGLPRFGHVHVREVERLLAGTALTAPQVERVAQTKASVVVPGVGTRQRTGAVELVLRPVVPFQVCLAIALQLLGRFADTGQCPRFADPRGGHGQAWAAGYGQFQPAIQLAIAIGLPPLLARPVGVRGGLGDGVVSEQGVGLQRLGLRGDAPGSDTARQGQAQGTGTERIQRSDDATRHSCDFPRSG
ncbi:hypothetical protein PS623_04608 [Pseudomonas fluorescens]|nr:hypothetical protein PS623_04608 [Pseudomonas fluorescens]